MTETNQTSKAKLWTARVMSGIIVLFMLFDGIFKFIKPKAVVKGTLEFGYAEHHIPIIGTLALVSAILYAIPRTSILGAILLTGYFGGAVATHLRVDAPLFSHTLFSVYFAVVAWGGIWLRNEKLRNLIPIQKEG